MKFGLHKYRTALSSRPKTLPQDRCQTSTVRPKPLVEEAGSNPDLRRCPVAGVLGTVAPVKHADLGSSGRRKPWIFERRIRPSEVSGTLLGNRRKDRAGEAKRNRQNASDSGRRPPRRSRTNAYETERPPGLFELQRLAGARTRAIRATPRSTGPTSLNAEPIWREKQRRHSVRAHRRRCEMSASLGITVFFMNKYFPAVRQAIAEQHRRCASSTTAQRRERLFLDVRKIAADLQGRGFYPSVNKIVERLAAGSCREWKTISLAVRETREALGISK